MSLVNPPSASTTSFADSKRTSRSSGFKKAGEQPKVEKSSFFGHDETVRDFFSEFSQELNALTLTSIARLSDSEMNWLTRGDMLFIIQKVVSATSADQFYVDVLFVVSKDDETVRKIAWLARTCARNLVGIRDWN